MRSGGEGTLPYFRELHIWGFPKIGDPKKVP